MKILLIGYYDYSYYAGACVLENDEIKDIELTEKQLMTIHDNGGYGGNPEEYKKIEEEIFSQYDMVILCEDGSFELLQASKELKELEEVELPKVKKVADGIFCFESDQGMVFMPKAKYEENEKKIKALEIIKKKKVNVWTLLETKTYAEYNFKEVVIKPKRKLTQAEYDLLKEILK